MDNYELIKMLIYGDTLTFRDRLQSFIEQLPDNKRSVNKEGFFPLFILGGFLALPDTELGESLGVKQVFFRTEKYVKNKKSYVNGVKFAILTLSGLVVSFLTTYSQLFIIYFHPIYR